MEMFNKSLDFLLLKKYFISTLDAHLHCRENVTVYMHVLMKLVYILGGKEFFPV